MENKNFYDYFYKNGEKCVDYCLNLRCISIDLEEGIGGVGGI